MEKAEAIKGVEVNQNKDLNHWEELLNEWVFLTEKYCRGNNEGDATYWYNEMANVSVISAAAWRCGNIALQEFSHNKGRNQDSNPRERADLWIGVGKFDDIIEAKIKWLNLEFNGKNFNSITTKVNSALDDAKESNPSGENKSKRAVGVVFCPLYVSKNSKENINDKIKEYIEKFKKLDYHALAWSFPKEARELEHEGYLYPGVVLLAINKDYYNKKIGKRS